MYGITTVQQERAMRNDDQNVILGWGAVGGLDNIGMWRVEEAVGRNWGE
jgi:hypothetical protein